MGKWEIGIMSRHRENLDVIDVLYPDCGDGSISELNKMHLPESLPGASPALPTALVGIYLQPHQAYLPLSKAILSVHLTNF